MADAAAGLLERAEGYLLTARAAFDAGLRPQAFENARTAAELAAKSVLQRAGIRYGKEHNVARELVTAGGWPPGEPAKRLSKFLEDFTRGVYGFHEPVTSREAERALRLASEVIEHAKSRFS